MIYKFISSFEFANEAWQILQTIFEDIIDVKRSCFTMLKTRFDELRMFKTETLSEFYAFFALGEKLDECVLVQKIVCVFPDRIDTKFIVTKKLRTISK